MIMFTPRLLKFVPWFSRFLIDIGMRTLGGGSTLDDGARWFTKLSSEINADFGIEGEEIGVIVGYDGGFGIDRIIVVGFVADPLRSSAVDFMVSKSVWFGRLGRYIPFFVFSSDT